MMVRGCKLIAQIIFLYALSAVGTYISGFLPIKIPGSILGIIFLFIALQQRWLPLTWVEDGANLLIGELLLFFVPSVVGITQFVDLIWQDWRGLGIAILVSTLSMLSFIYLMTGVLGKVRERREEV